jgi:hypothetical protein
MDEGFVPIVEGVLCREVKVLGDYVKVCHGDGFGVGECVVLL